MTYKAYLEKERYSPATVKRSILRLRNYKDWCTQTKTDPDHLDYPGFLKYVKYLRSKKWKPQSVNNQLRSIKRYFDYLMVQDIRGDNPAVDVKVRREKTKVLTGLLSADELEDLYYSFESENIRDQYFKATAKRNKVITGLIVYQGLNSAALAALKTEHLQLYKGKIYIPSTSKSNGRTLELKSWQVIEMMEYINEHRPKIQQRINLYNNRLFPLNTDQFNSILNSIIKKLRQINHKVKNVNQLRASVITNWLSNYNIRQVQQMAGHKYISSTEKYKQDKLENLQEAINTFHPIH